MWQKPALWVLPLLQIPLPTGLSRWAQWRPTLTFQPLPSITSLKSAKIQQTRDQSSPGYFLEAQGGIWERRWRETTFGSSYREVRKNEGSRSRDSIEPWSRVKRAADWFVGGILFHAQSFIIVALCVCSRLQTFALCKKGRLCQKISKHIFFSVNRIVFKLQYTHDHYMQFISDNCRLFTRKSK